MSLLDAIAVLTLSLLAGWGMFMAIIKVYGDDEEWL